MTEVILRKTSLWILLFVIITLVACSSNTREMVTDNKNLNPGNDASNETNKSKSEEKNENQNNEMSEPFLTGTHFEDPNAFIVYDFKMSHDSSDNSVSFRVTYKFGDKPRKYILEGKHPYYFYISVPESLAKYYTLPETIPVKGEELISDDDNLKYQVDIKASLKKGLPKDVINSIINKPQGYSITVFENPDYPAKRIVGVYEFVYSIEKI
ncbi:hypothetical protein P4H61_22955 [Paenibacillus peoriae]|uniref:hypothetical protein n=1 Tax=Paenibacillus peoriae TaxID=59893 RepID=UPI001F52315E|nr:hypothetical protein [Paenibacillus peoriae]MEC0184347.1 hypothetical protein [Paenibacillus peoriae]